MRLCRYGDNRVGVVDGDFVIDAWRRRYHNSDDAQ